MSDDYEIPTTAICSACGVQRGEHSAGSFHCPDSPASVGTQARFTNSTFAL
jgi:hypothetical protein